MFLYTVGTFWS